MLNYETYLKKLDGVGRFFARRARRRFHEHLEEDESIRGIVQGKGRTGQEVWVCTDRRIGLLRVGLLSKQFTEINIAQITSCTVMQDRMFSVVRLETPDNHRLLKQVTQSTADDFRRFVHGVIQ